MNIILFGFKRCGKTHYGKRLAKELSLPFIDTDNLIEELYAKKTKEHIHCRSIFEKIGNEAFRKLEHEAVLSLKNVKDSVISVGGGAILDEENQKVLKEVGLLVYLEVDKETLKKRTLQKDLPAYLDPKDPEGSFEKMYLLRKPVYEKIFAKKVLVDEKNEKEVLITLCNLMRNSHGE